jgi:hypothetical protein
MSGHSISSGPVDVVASGVVIAFKNNPIEVAVHALQMPLNLSPQIPQIALNWPPTTPVIPSFKFIFRFVDDPSVSPTTPNPTIDAKAVESFVLDITLRNFTSPLGGGNTEPLKVGHAFGRSLYISYRVYQLQAGDKSLAFTIYQSRTQDHPVTPPEVKDEPKSNA